MVIIVNPNLMCAERIGGWLKQFDARAGYQIAESCSTAWLPTVANRPWLIVCDAADPAAMEYLLKSREYLPNTYFVLTGLPPASEGLESADAIVGKLGREALESHFRAARERNRAEPADPAKEESGQIFRKKWRRPAASDIKVTVSSDRLSFKVAAPEGIRLDKFLEQLGKETTREVRLFRGAEMLGSARDLALEDGDRLELKPD